MNWINLSSLSLFLFLASVDQNDSPYWLMLVYIYLVLPGPYAGFYKYRGPKIKITMGVQGHAPP